MAVRGRELAFRGELLLGRRRTRQHHDHRTGDGSPTKEEAAFGMPPGPDHDDPVAKLRS
jgi:hypothetical protein